MAEITGKWKLAEAHGLKNFCEVVQKKIPQEELHTVEYTNNEETGEYTQTLLYGNNFLQALWLMDYGPQAFKSGEQFTHKDLSGSNAKSTITVDGNRIVHTQIYGEGEQQVEIRIEREFNGDKMSCKLSYSAADGSDCNETIDAEFVRV